MNAERAGGIKGVTRHDRSDFLSFMPGRESSRGPGFIDVAIFDRAWL